MRSNLLTILTIAGVVLGGVLGFCLRAGKDNWTERQIMYVNFLGDIFLRMLKALILPLILSSLVSAIANLDLSLSGKIAARAIIYYLTTTFLAVVLGIILVTLIRPGDNSTGGSKMAPGNLRNITTDDTLLDLVRSMFPPNLVEACIKQHRTLLIPPKTNPNERDLSKWLIRSESVDGTNILGLVVFSAVLGITLAKIGEEGRPMTNFFQAMMSAMMTITTWVIWLSPVGIFFLVASKIVEMDDFGQTMSQMGMYFATVFIGIIIQGFIFLPTIYFIMTRKNPIKFISNMGQALATAFGTASSAATLPVTMACLENNNNVDVRVSRFALPIGATINMDGTALYEAVAALFIAQVRRVDLSIGSIIAVSITATAASIGAAGIPQAGLVTLVMVLDTVGLPAEDVTLVLAIDWILDRLRTTINVLGDAFGAGIVDHMSKKELLKMKDGNSNANSTPTRNGNSNALHAHQNNSYEMDEHV